MGESITQISQDLTIPDIHIAAEAVLDGKKTANDAENLVLLLRSNHALYRSLDSKSKKQTSNTRVLIQSNSLG
jgi:replicative DNA helicase